MAWLMKPHLEAGIDTRKKHVDTQVDLCSDIGFPRRRDGRQWLVDRHETFKLLLDLEAAFRGDGRDEPRAILHRG